MSEELADDYIKGSAWVAGLAILLFIVVVILF